MTQPRALTAPPPRTAGPGTVIPFRPRGTPCPQVSRPQAPPASPNRLRPLLVLSYVLPGWTVEFETTVEGEEGAFVMPPGRPIRIAYVASAAGTSSDIVLSDGQSWKDLGRFATPDDLVAFIRAAQERRAGPRKNP